MPHSQQSAQFLSIKKLKNISNLERLPLAEKNLTAILGVNGCGKSTILHALSCCYKPPSNSDTKNHLFSHWFTPTVDSTWVGSEFILSHKYRSGEEVHEVDQSFTKLRDRWSPRYDKRIERHVELIGIDTCVPKIEQERQVSFIQYETNPDGSAVAKNVRAVASEIFNRQYTEFNQHRVSKTKNYIGLAHRGIRYSALSMGAGEQRLLHILTKAFQAPKNSLILIDEIDLLLHTNALHALLRHLHARATEKNLQIIFTTHRESVLELDDILSIKHLYQNDEKTHWLSDTKPETLTRLTGRAERSVEVFVEDHVSEAIVHHLVAQLGMRRHTDIRRFGAAQNSFTIAGSLVLKGDVIENVLIVLDGDVYLTDAEKAASIQKVLTGNEKHAAEMRSRALEIFTQFDSRDGKPPDAVLLEMILGLDPSALTEQQREIHACARQCTPVVDHHDSIKKICNLIGYGYKDGVNEIIKIASHSSEWSIYTEPIYRWLREKKEQLQETLN
jgi:AAA15 family ATPase/GTPase